MLKIILSFVFVISASLLGNTFSLKLMNRRKTLTSIVNAISRAKTLICFGSFDTRRVVAESFCSEDFPLMNCNDIDCEKPYDKAFESSVDKINNRFSLTKADKELLVQFGSKLGSTDVTGQVAHAELYIELFNERLSKAREEESSKSKLYRVLGFSLGCAISLLVV